MNNSAENPPRRHLYLPTRVNSTQKIHWESQSILEWMSSFADQEEGLGAVTHFPASTKSFVPAYQAERYQRLSDHCRVHSNHANFWSEYQAIQSLHHFLMNKITSQWSITSPEYPLAFERLYHETSDRLESLLSSFSSHESPAEKADMAQYMTNWLRDNWINPYPDDIVLNEMATACGTTPAIISNWLINARTRKWRPAIVKATQLNRPADRLLEDSLCFFDGRPIRSLQDNVVLQDGDHPWESPIEDDAAMGVPATWNEADEDDYSHEDWVNHETGRRSIKRPRID